MAEDRFLSRWSRRKSQNRKRPASVAAVAPVGETLVPEDEEGQVLSTEPVPSAKLDTSEITQPEEATVLSDEELSAKAEELGLPDIDSLGPGSDFKAFMASDVPAQLRSLALRRLWRSNPVLANVDGLVDYGEDFTDAATVVENMQTAYQVGRGYRRDPEPEEKPEPEEDLDVAEEGAGPSEEDGDSATDAQEDTDLDSDPNPDAESEVADETQTMRDEQSVSEEDSDGVDIAIHSRNQFTNPDTTL